MSTMTKRDALKLKPGDWIACGKWRTQVVQVTPCGDIRVRTDRGTRLVSYLRVRRPRRRYLR